MDTQIKCRIQKLSYNELEVYEQSYVVFDETNEYQFELCETDNVYVIFQFDPNNVRLYYEPFDSATLKQVEPGMRIHLTSGREQEGTYFAGYFNLEAYIINKHVVYQFFVKPKNLNYETVVHLRRYVDNFYQGLSSDLSKLRSTQANALKDSNKMNAYSKYLFLEQHLMTLLSYMNQYIAKKYKEPIKKKEISKHPSKMSAASIRYLIQKGHQHNKDLSRPNHVLVEKTRFEVDVVQNQIFKQEMLFWNKEVFEVEEMLEERVQYYESKMQEIQQRITYLNNQLQLFEDEKRISKRTVISYQREIENLQHTLETFTLKHEHVSKSKHLMHHFKSNIEYNIYHTWIQEVSTIDQYPKHIKDLRLRLMFDLKQQYNGKSKQEKQLLNQGTFAKKATPKLFETYIYIVLIRTLMHQGYRFDQDVNLMETVSNPSMIQLRKNDLVCKIYYDQSLKRSNDPTIESEYVTINSMHNSPDFILSFENEEGIQDAIVIEVKWRPLQNIYNELEDTSVVDHLKDYYNLGYHKQGVNKTQRAMIRKVIVVYPDEQERFVPIQFDEIVGVGLLPSEDFVSSNGYRLLNDAIFEEFE